MYLANSYKKCSQPNSPRLASAALRLQGFGVSILAYAFFHGFVNTQFRCDFSLSFAFTHWFLLYFAQVGKWGCMRYGRNVKGICGLGLGHFLSTYFSSILLVHSFVRFFIEFCVCNIVFLLCFGHVGRWGENITCYASASGNNINSL